MQFIDRVIYRVRQFWLAINSGPLEPDAWNEIEKILTSSEIQLFKSQTIGGQQHGYRVMQSLVKAGHDNSELLAAALLHDIGKYRIRNHWWDRPLVVLGEALVPEHAATWGNGKVEGWSRPFVVRSRHAAWGADAAAESGSSRLTVRLIRRHQETLSGPTELAEDEFLVILQWADNKN